MREKRKVEGKRGRGERRKGEMKRGEKAERRGDAITWDKNASEQSDRKDERKHQYGGKVNEENSKDKLPQIHPILANNRLSSKPSSPHIQSRYRTLHLLEFGESGVGGRRRGRGRRRGGGRRGALADGGGGDGGAGAGRHGFLRRR